MQKREVGQSRWIFRTTIIGNLCKTGKFRLYLSGQRTMTVTFLLRIQWRRLMMNIRKSSWELQVTSLRKGVRKMRQDNYFLRKYYAYYIMSIWIWNVNWIKCYDFFQSYIVVLPMLTRCINCHLFYGSMVTLGCILYWYSMQVVCQDTASLLVMALNCSTMQLFVLTFKIKYTSKYWLFQKPLYLLTFKMVSDM